MIKADSDRLLKALLISIMFHAFMFAGMNLLDWFPEADIIERFAPITLRIEKGSPSSPPPLVEEEIDLSPPETLEPDKVLPVTESREQPPKTVTEKYTPSDAPYDPYESLTITDDSSIPFTLPFQDDSDVTESEYVPMESTIEYDPTDSNTDPLDIRERDSTDAVSDDKPIISNEKIDNLTAALTNSGEQDSSEPINETETDRTLYSLKDFPIEFSNPGVNRYLLSEPSVTIPPDILSEISSERTVIIGFSLDDDGILHRLNIKRSSGYTPLDISIMSEIRMWKFDKDPGARDVEGTVTIILKGK